MIDQAGFSLVEVLTISMILGILAMAGIPTIGSVLGYYKLASASRIMVGGIETTANLSIRYGRPFKFTMDTSTNSFDIRDTAPYPDTSASVRRNNQPPVNAASIVFNGATGSWYEVDLDALSSLEGIKIDSGPEELTFYPDGHSIYTDSQYVLSFGDQKKTITINGINGRILVE